MFMFRGFLSIVVQKNSCLVLRLNVLTAIPSTYGVESLCSEEPAVGGPDPPRHQGGGEGEKQ